ncbi:MAG: YHS domain-containing protein [Acidobacteriota bacterium]
MIRALFMLIAAIVAISFLRGIIGILARAFTNATVQPPGSRGASPSPETLKPEALKRDPVCGTFVAPSTAVRKEKDGQTYYFCSEACRDRF